jgi:hypothetical protein
MLGHRKKIAKFLLRTFSCRSTFLYEENKRSCSNLFGGAHCQTHLIRVQMFSDDISIYSFIDNSFMAFNVRELSKCIPEPVFVNFCEA